MISSSETTATVAGTAAAAAAPTNRPSNANAHTNKDHDDPDAYKPPTLISAAANRRIYAKPGSVKEKIQMFGGERPLLQRRLDQLTKKWELDANKTGGTRTKKKKGPKMEWYSSPKSGAYRKRIVYG